MNLLEAAQALLDGKKVRRKGWEENRYIVIDEENRLVTEKGRNTNMIHPIVGTGGMSYLLLDDWDVYSPEKTLSFRGEILDIVKHCQMNRKDGGKCNSKCMMSNLCEFKNIEDLSMADFLLDEELDYKDLNVEKIDIMWALSK